MHISMRKYIFSVLCFNTLVRRRKEGRITYSPNTEVQLCLFQWDVVLVCGNIYFSWCAEAINNLLVLRLNGILCKDTFYLYFAGCVLIPKCVPTLMRDWYFKGCQDQGCILIFWKVMRLMQHLCCSLTEGHLLPWQLHKHSREGLKTIYRAVIHYTVESQSLCGFIF